MSKEETLIWAENNKVFKTINKIINWIEIKIIKESKKEQEV